MRLIYYCRVTYYGRDALPLPRVGITIYYLPVTFYSVSRADRSTLNFITCILYEGLG